MAIVVAIVATGATPKRVPGSSGLALRTKGDAEGLRSELRSGANLAVIGAGLIGCEVAATARAMEAPVTLIDVLLGASIDHAAPRRRRRRYRYRSDPRSLADMKVRGVYASAELRSIAAGAGLVDRVRDSLRGHPVG